MNEGETMKNELFSKDEKLYIRTSYDNTVKVREVIRGWESYSGWYWLAVELDHKQDSIINPTIKDGKYVEGSGEVIKDDKIYFGLVQGFEEEWGYFSEAEINSLGIKAWEIPKENLPHSGRRD